MDSTPCPRIVLLYSPLLHSVCVCVRVCVSGLYKHAHIYCLLCATPQHLPLLVCYLFWLFGPKNRPVLYDGHLPSRFPFQVAVPIPVLGQFRGNIKYKYSRIRHYQFHTARLVGTKYCGSVSCELAFVLCPQFYKTASWENNGNSKMRISVIFKIKCNQCKLKLLYNSQIVLEIKLKDNTDRNRLYFYKLATSSVTELPVIVEYLCTYVFKFIYTTF